MQVYVCYQIYFAITMFSLTSVLYGSNVDLDPVKQDFVTKSSILEKMNNKLDRTSTVVEYSFNNAQNPFDEMWNDSALSITVTEQRKQFIADIIQYVTASLRHMNTLYTNLQSLREKNQQNGILIARLQSEKTIHEPMRNEQDSDSESLQTTIQQNQNLVQQLHNEVKACKKTGEKQSTMSKLDFVVPGFLSYGLHGGVFKPFLGIGLCAVKQLTAMLPCVSYAAMLPMHTALGVGLGISIARIVYDYYKKYTPQYNAYMHSLKEAFEQDKTKLVQNDLKKKYGISESYIFNHEVIKNLKFDTAPELKMFRIKNRIQASLKPLLFDMCKTGIITCVLGEILYV